MEEGEKVNIKVKTLNNELYEVTVGKKITVKELKKHVEEVVKVPFDKQRLLLRGKLLVDFQTLEHYKILEGQVIQLVATAYQPSIASSQSSRLNRSQAARIDQFRNRNNFYQRHRYLQRRMNGFRINQPESLEVLQQNECTINQLINSLSPVDEMPAEPFCFSNRKFQVGTWVDVKDSMNQWYEGQVISVNGEYVLVHYNGWSDRWNEWINRSSNRIMPFRSNTVQPTHSFYMSPWPLNSPALTRSSNPQFQKNLSDFLYSFEKTLGKINNLVRQCQLQRQDSQFDDANTFREEFKVEIDKGPEISYQSIDHKLDSEPALRQETLHEEKEIETPTKQIHHNVSLNDNLSNKCDDNVSNKCQNDDISNKSYKSKRSEGLVDTSSMKSLKIEEKASVFFDLEAKSVRSMKSQIHKTAHNTYLNQPTFQQNILEEEDSQLQQQDSCYDLGKRGSQRHKKQEKIQREATRMMKVSQLAPLLDRMGRLMIDLAPHIALLGDTNQIQSHENLSVITNEGSLQSRIVNYLRSQRPEAQALESHSPAPQYCDFQIPIMLTPIQIYALNQIQSQSPNMQ